MLTNKVKPESVSVEYLKSRDFESAVLEKSITYNYG